MVMKKNRKVSFFSKYNKYIYIVSGGFAIGIIAFFITVNTYKLDNELLEEKRSQVIKNDENNIALLQDQSSIRTAEETNTGNEENPQVSEDNNRNIANVTQVSQDNQAITVATKPQKKEEDKKQVTFIMPLDGEIIMEYAKDKLIYSKTLEEWITHTAIDIKGEEASPVKAVADGKVKDIKLDPRYGNTIIVEHQDGYKSIYSNLTTTDLVKINQTVVQGEIISGVGRGYGFESEEGPHIHYELMKDGEYVNLLDILK